MPLGFCDDPYYEPNALESWYGDRWVDYDYLIYKSNKGDGKASFALGMWHAFGESGYGDSDKKAFDFLKASARQNHSAGKYMLATCYLYGTGCKQSERLAKMWLSSAANDGDADAEVLLHEKF